MKLENLNFDQWLKNHSTDHKDKWCRELYPFNVFRLINFDKNFLNTEQELKFNNISYNVTITKIELQDNGRYKTTFEMGTHYQSKTQQWKKRKWNTVFQIIYTQQFEFITIFTKKEDPSKNHVVRFMRGNFENITSQKSLPISELLVKTLILHIAEEAFPGGSHNHEYKFTKEAYNDRPEHPQFPRKKINHFNPLYSKGLDMWICYSFSEEMAHKIAFYNANQCDKLIVVYCNPTHTRHHRCKYEGIEVISIYELSEKISSEVRNKYGEQIRFLQNHLNPSEVIDTHAVLNEINHPIREEYEIQKADLNEALAVMKILPKSEIDFFYLLCCMNLLNAYTGKHKRDKEKKMFKNPYYFKSYLSEILTEVLKAKDFSYSMYIENSLIMVEIYGFQFSFHSMPLNETLKNFSNSKENKKLEWSGKRLQPIAPLLLKYSRGIRNK